jgi:hypothetical protein
MAVKSMKPAYLVFASPPSCQRTMLPSEDHFACLDISALSTIQSIGHRLQILLVCVLAVIFVGQADQ